MAALAGLAIDNVLIEIDNEEVPIVDGSSIEYVKLFQQAGIVEQDADKNIFELKEVITWKDSNSDIEIMAIPSESFKVSVLVDYKTKVLGMQHAELNNISDFAKEIAPARTFVFT